MNNLVVVKKNDIFTDSLIIAKGTGFEHHTITRKIRDFTSDFKELGEIRFMDTASNNLKGGRPTRTYLLNEPQASFLLTLLRSSRPVIEFKKKLTKELLNYQIAVGPKFNIDLEYGSSSATFINLQAYCCISRL